MKIFEYTHPAWGFAFKRISNAFHQHAPEWVEWVPTWEQADVNLVHVVGGGEVPILQLPKPKIIIQHCYFTASPNELDYPKYWEEALLTCSFHKLPNYTDKKFNYHGMPWGADNEIFSIINTQAREFKIGTTGHIAETEGIDKVYEAIQQIPGAAMWHTGQNFGWDPNKYRFYNYMPDQYFYQLLNHTQYISAMRFIEGFELMAIEGLMCGARPIVTQDDTYDWYRKHAYTVDTTKDIVPQLISILENPPRPITAEEYEEIVNTFSWKTIMNNFYERVKEFK